MNVNFEEFDQMLKGFVEGSLSLEEQAHMEQLLLSDSEARNRYLDYMEVEAMLSSHKVKIEHSESPKPKPKTIKKRTVKVRKIPPQKKRKRKTSLFLLTAAAMFLASGLFYYIKIQKKDVAFATVVSITGKASVINNNKTQEVIKGMKIQDFSELVCSKGNNSILLRTDDQSTYRISANSSVKFSKNENSTKIELISGFIKAQVSKQPFAKPVIISTPEADLTVLGTVFRVNVEDLSTALIVDEGKVEIKNSKNKKTVIKENEMAIATAGEIKTRNIEKFKVKKLEILNAEYGAGDKWVDVTSLIRDRTGNSRLIRTGKFVDLAGDPLYKTPKSLKVRYRIDGQEGTAVFYEYLTDVVNPANFRKEIILSKHL